MTAALALRHQPGWKLAGACNDLVTPDTDPWLPDDELPPHVQARLIAFAKQVCAGCPVRDVCLADALATGEAWAVRGGLTAAERRPVAAARGFPRPSVQGASQHGTRGRYVEGCHDGVGGGACARCRRANATYMAGWRTRRPVTRRGSLVVVLNVIEKPTGRGLRRVFPGQVFLSIGVAA